ncbi:MAG: GMC family oxidoreductase [Chloroflexota bacterium]
MKTQDPTLPPISADVAIVGTGVAGALIGWSLASAGINVVLVEAGPTIDRAGGAARYRASLTQTPDSAYEVQPYAPWPRVITKNDYYVLDGGQGSDFQSTYLRAVGGTTWHWLGSMPRLLPTDFLMKTTYGVAVDWPITYDDLEPWYMAGEKQLGVSGFDEDDLGSWRSGPYPLPGIPMTYSDKRFAAVCDPIGLKVSPTPQARNSTEYEGRPACCGNAMCIPICPIGAKYDATVHVGLAAAAGATVMDEAVVADVAVDADGKVSGLTYLKPDGIAGVVTAKAYVIAANAIETAKLLMISATDALPNGVANSSDMVGRNLADHPVRLSVAISKDPVYPYRSPLATSGIENLREGDFRSDRSAFRIEIANDGWSWLGLAPVGWAQQAISKGAVGKDLWNAVYETTPHQVRLGSLCEQLPNPEHRVQPAENEVDALGIPRPKLTFGIDDYTQAGLDEAILTHDKIFDALGVDKREHIPQWQGAGHLMGTHLMGTDPKTSVTDSFGRTHDHPNLFLAGAGLFPTTGTANPTNTVAALALRAAGEIASSLSSM